MHNVAFVLDLLKRETYQSTAMRGGGGGAGPDAMLRKGPNLSRWLPSSIFNFCPMDVSKDGDRGRGGRGGCGLGLVGGE